MISIQDIARGLQDKKIIYKLLKIGKWTNMMAKIFNEEISDCEVIDLDDALQLIDKISSVVVRDLVSSGIDVLNA